MRDPNPAPGFATLQLSQPQLHEVAVSVMEDLAEDKEAVKAQTQKVVEEMKVPSRCCFAERSGKNRTAVMYAQIDVDAYSDPQSRL